jgi:hypothetical protein
MRRFLLLIVSVFAVGSICCLGSASASTLRVRVDPNDSSSNLDIHKVITNLSATTMYLRVRSWDRFKAREMHAEWDFTLDTFGSPEFDRGVAIARGRRGIVCTVYNLKTGASLGSRPATRPDVKSAACHLPRTWFGHIDRAVRFRVFALLLGSGHVSDKAPGHGRVYRSI